MSTQQSTETDRMPGEPLLWYRRFTRYKLMQPTRSVAAVFREEQQAQSTEESGGKRRTEAPGSWYDMAEKWEWSARAAAYDAEQTRQLEQQIADARAKVLTKGLALMHKRVEALNAVASKLLAMATDESKVWVADVKSIGTGKDAQRVDLVQFNGELFREIREYLTDLAEEMGERVKKTELSAKIHNSGRIAVVLPKKKPIDSVQHQAQPESGRSEIEEERG